MQAYDGPATCQLVVYVASTRLEIVGVGLVVIEVPIVNRVGMNR